jgi:P-type Cu+ transporter
MENKYTFDIKGMSCTSCAANIEKVLQRHKGVKSAQLNFANEKAYVEAEESVTPTEIVDIIDRLGYKALLKQEQFERASLRIKGMSCAGCASNIQKRLKTTSGVNSAVVNFANAALSIEYDRSIISLTEIKKIVAGLGYQAESENKLDASGDEEKQQLLVLRKRMIRSAILAGLIMLLMVLKMARVPIPAYHLITVVLGFPVVFIFGYKVHRSSFNSIRHGTANMDVLVSLGSLPPYLIGLSGFFFDVQTFIEMATMIMTFHLIGKYLETKAKGKTSEAIKKLIQLGAKTARIEREGKPVEVAVDSLEIGDVMLIKPGEKVPTDGVIVEGSSSLDESMMTGESMPVKRKEGDEVIGATINRQGFIKAKVTKIGRETFLAQVIKLVEECQGSKVPIQDFADRVTGYFVPVIIGVTVLTFISYNLFPAFHRGIIEWGATFLPWINPELPTMTLAFITATAVLVIACPCALGLGTPTALMVGSGLGAKNGILIRSGEAVQTLREVKAVAFDKTGTITKGKPEITDIKIYGERDQEELIRLVSSLENRSEHPLALAVMDKAEKMGIKPLAVKHFESHSGMGIVGSVEGTEVIVGNGKIMDKFKVEYKHLESDLTSLENEAKTVLMVAVAAEIIGIMAIADEIKEDSKRAISLLTEMGIATIMITGDNVHTAKAIAEKAGIKEVVAEVLPQGKVDAIVQLQKRFRPVAMVGDGINDAPALKQADVGISLGTGTDVAIEAGDVTLVRSDLMNVVASIKLSKAIFRKIKENFFWAWLYNAVAIPVAILGLLHPMIGAAAMSMSSLNVVHNSLRLKKARINPEK